MVVPPFASRVSSDFFASFESVERTSALLVCHSWQRMTSRIVSSSWKTASMRYRSRSSLGSARTLTPKAPKSVLYSFLYGWYSAPAIDMSSSLAVESWCRTSPQLHDSSFIAPIVASASGSPP